MQIDHLVIPVLDYESAKRFYLRALEPFGFEVLLDWHDRRRASSTFIPLAYRLSPFATLRKPFWPLSTAPSAPARCSRWTIRNGASG